MRSIVCFFLIGILVGCAGNQAPILSQVPIQSEKLDGAYNLIASCTYESISKKFGAGIKKVDFPEKKITKVSRDSGQVLYWELVFKGTSPNTTNVALTTVNTVWGPSKVLSKEALPAARACAQEVKSKNKTKPISVATTRKKKQPILRPNFSAGSPWNFSMEKSRIDDSTNVYLSVPAKAPTRDRYGRLHHAKLHFACRENKTSMWINFNDHMSDHGGYGIVTFRIDGHPAFKEKMRESTDNQALGFWSGDSAIPFAKKLVDASNLLVRATPYGESQITIDFPIKEIDLAIQPLQRACSW